MPIRFRCQHCNQLLGIARRKAGTAVHCPTCQHEVIVPQADQTEAAAPVQRPVFERSDFEAYLQQPVADAPGAGPAPPAAADGPNSFDVERVPFPSVSGTYKPANLPNIGLVLSPTQATLLTVAGILLLALAFGAGLLVGRYAL